MIVPKYWAEAQQTAQVANGQRTIKRFGWSDDSEAMAQQHAEQRLTEALATLNTTGNVRKVDHKIAYNGADGLPIREQVIAKQDDIVISRNSYGALCLNTPSVLFADIDCNPHHGGLIPTWILLLLVGLILSWTFPSNTMVSLGATALTLAMCLMLFKLDKRARTAKLQSQNQRQLDNIRSVSQRYPELHLRVYRTPAGYRILCMNELFDPRSDRAQQLLKDLQSDPLYMQLCINQRCFRARISPKPWRIGMNQALPSGGTWPIKAERLPPRNAWVQQYEKKSSRYASCHYIERLGAEQTLAEAEQVQRLHDEYCRALKTELPAG
jgi:hypothetical protein